MSFKLEELREDYRRAELLESSAAADPFAQFEHWFEQARTAQLPEPNAMVLATATASGRPSARVVLLKEVTAAGFVFYTNYNSRKADEMAENDRVALVFNWLELQQQVRIEGRVVPIDPAESTAYFQSRPRGSQIGAWASPQSSVIPNRKILEDKVSELEQQYASEPTLPRPDFWGGYVVHPTAVEFWQGRSSRLHDRLRYTRDDSGEWRLERLAP